MGKGRSRGNVRVNQGRLEISAYAGIDPGSGRPQRIYDYLPLDTGDREVERRRTALVARGDAMAAARKARRSNPYAEDLVVSADPRRTVTDALEAWWEAHGRHLQGGGERGLIDTYLKPNLGPVELWRLRSSVDATLPNAGDFVDLTEFFARLRPIRKEQFRPDTLRLIRNVLRGALHREVGAGGLESNPVVEAKLPRGEERESTTPEADQVAAFFKFLEARRVMPARKVTRRVGGTDRSVVYEIPERVIAEDLEVTVRAYARMVMAGPRPQEVSALRRSSYDPATGRLRLLGEGIVREKKDGDQERWVHRRGQTVKRRKRTIVLDAGLRRELAVMMAEQDDLAAAAGTVCGPRSYLFSDDPDGSGPINPRVAGRNFDRAVSRAVAAGVDVPAEMRLYDMRHFGITRLVRDRCDITAIAHRYATSQEMIYRVYAHGGREDDDGLADKLGGWG